MAIHMDIIIIKIWAETDMLGARRTTMHHSTIRNSRRLNTYNLFIPINRKQH